MFYQLLVSNDPGLFDYIHALLDVHVYCNIPRIFDTSRGLPSIQLSYYGRSSNVGQIRHSLGLVQVELSTSISGSHVDTYVLKLFVY